MESRAKSWPWSHRTTDKRIQVHSPDFATVKHPLPFANHQKPVTYPSPALSGATREAYQAPFHMRFRVQDGAIGCDSVGWIQRLRSLPPVLLQHIHQHV